jgi:hypothetical protein
MFGTHSLAPFRRLLSTLACVAMLGAGLRCSSGTEAPPSRDLTLVRGLWIQGASDTLIIYGNSGPGSTTELIREEGMWLVLANFTNDGSVTFTRWSRQPHDGLPAPTGPTSEGAYTFDVTPEKLTFLDPSPASVPDVTGSWSRVGPPPPLIP